VDENHTAVVRLPDEISPEHHTLHIILHEQDTLLQEECPETFPTVTVSQWPQNLSLRREDLYDNDGR